MASPWYSLVSQKLYLAQVLIRDFEQQGASPGLAPAVLNEARTQAVTELLLRARATLLVMIARLHQEKTEAPASLAQLKALFAFEVPEIKALEELSQARDSWWNHLAQLDRRLGQPPASRKTVSADNIIAVAPAAEPDRSWPALDRTRQAMAAFVQELEERHSEW